MTAQTLPLAGIRVVDYSHFLASPFVSRCFAARDAEVVKVERSKEGDAGRAHAWLIGGQNGYYLQQNVGKQELVAAKLGCSPEEIETLVDESVLYAEATVAGAAGTNGEAP
jgi:hypothetical protein